jgi:hypothetical protein
MAFGNYHPRGKILLVGNFACANKKNRRGKGGLLNKDTSQFTGIFIFQIFLFISIGTSI